MKTKRLSQLLATCALVAAFGLSPAVSAAPTAPSTSAVSQTSAATVNVNTATETELAYLPGVGPAKAAAIIAHRQKSPFKKVDELTRVKGIGRKSLDKLRAHVTIDGPTTAKAPIRAAR